MARRVAFIESSHDSVTQSMHAARRWIFYHSVALPSNSQITPFFSTNASIGVIGNADGFYLVSGSGHGVSETFKGHNNQPLLTSMSTPQVNGCVRKSIVHLLACMCGHVYGSPPNYYGLAFFLTQSSPHIARAFIGYRADIPINPPWSHEQLRAVLRPDCSIDKWILEGLNASQVYRNLRQMLREMYIQVFFNRNASRYSPRAVANFSLLYDHLVGPWTDEHKYGSF
jgi:hypothetical protein